ncbi:DUF3078 domain-containing protein [candidate division KSB1 bacterium]|nr:DUF3078 domain-containing protein [candidate division KSB1 bacterium]
MNYRAVHKWATTVVFLIVVVVNDACPAIRSQPDPNGGLFFTAPKISAEIDGILNEWQDYIPVNLSTSLQAKYRQQDWHGPGDCSAKFWWGWRDEGIVFAAEVIDDSVSSPFRENKLWANDCIQIVIDPLDDNSEDEYQNDDREFVITRIDTTPVIYEFAFSEHRRSGMRNYPVMITCSADTIRYEALVPWLELGISGSPGGMHIGASLVVFDNDGDDFRGWLEWTTGIAAKKFTLPYANILLHDKRLRMAQAIPTQPFLSVTDTLAFWIHSRYRRQHISYRLFDDNEILFRRSLFIHKNWTKISIPPEYLKWGQLKLEVTSIKTQQLYDIAVWSKHHITEQIAYLAQQAEVLKNFNGVDPSAHILVKHWVDRLQKRFSSAITDFDFYSVMNQAKKRIDQIPNFYMKRQVFYDREYRIAEKMYFSQSEQKNKRYLVYLPVDFDPRKKYPLFMFLHDRWENEEGMSRRIGQVLLRSEIRGIAIFPHEYSHLGSNQLSVINVTEHLKDVKKKFSIDERRIYIIGEGMGGRNALHFACQHPDQVAGVSIIHTDVDTSIDVSNLRYTPIQLVSVEEMRDKDSLFVKKLAAHDVRSRHMTFPRRNNLRGIYSDYFLKWLLTHRKAQNLRAVKLHVKNLCPASVYWLELLAMEDYSYPGSIDAVCDSNVIFIDPKNISGFSLIKDKLPEGTKFPLTVIINKRVRFTISENNPELFFYKQNNLWKKFLSEEAQLIKTRMISGPLSAIFKKNARYVYSTASESTEFNELTREIAIKTSQRGRDYYLDHLVVADTSVVDKPVTSNLFIIGNEQTNAYLKKMATKLPITVEKDGSLKFGRAQYFSEGNAAFYIYPNPMNTDYMMLVAIAPDSAGLVNIKNVWNLDYSNHIFKYDYVVIDREASGETYRRWIDYGYFDKNWQVQWFQPAFTGAPKRWHNKFLVGLDANQLSLNSNWQEGGKGNFTWKIYSRIESKYVRKRIELQNTLYLAFGQISVQENEKWHAPEKSNDVIDFDSVLRFTMEKYIDPYIAISFDTQFQEGRNPKTKALVSKFGNPFKLSQTAGIARNIVKKKKIKLTTRLGYGAKEIVATDRNFRKQWTGDESKWMKIDGGFEWYTESRLDFTTDVHWINKLKLFQAVFSSISAKKDPEKNWRKLDVYWEQLFTMQLTKYVRFNVVMKFLYDRDTSKGGQFLENASLGLSYRF